MSARALAWVMKQKIASRSLRAMMIVLAGYSDNDGVTTIGQGALAAEMDVTVRQIKRHLAALETLGIISRKKRSRGARGRATDEIALAVSMTFAVTRDDLPVAPSGSHRNRKEMSPSAAAKTTSQGDITPHLAQGDKNVTGSKRLITRGSAKLKSGQSNHGESSRSIGAKHGEVSAPVDGVPPTSELPPPGSKTLRRSKGSVYARHRTILDQVRRGTVH